jgi:hypothetical protein
MTRSVRTLGLSAALILAACATSPFDRHYNARRWSDAAAVFAADSSLHADARTLYRAALIHAAPGSDVHDPLRARALLDRLLSAHPTSGHAIDPATIALYTLLIDIEYSRAAAAAREVMLRDSLYAVTAEADRLRDEIGLLEARLGEERQATTDLRHLIDRLAADLRGREAQLTEIRDELARLKAIDLQRPPVRSY